MSSCRFEVDAFEASHLLKMTYMAHLVVDIMLLLERPGLIPGFAMW